MFSLLNLLWLALAGILALYWWQSGLYKGRARDLATAHCERTPFKSTRNATHKQNFHALNATKSCRQPVSGHVP